MSMMLEARAGREGINQKRHEVVEGRAVLVAMIGIEFDNGHSVESLVGAERTHHDGGSRKR